jgi:hypothetical protein
MFKKGILSRRDSVRSGALVAASSRQVRDFRVEQAVLLDDSEQPLTCSFSSSFLRTVAGRERRTYSRDAVVERAGKRWYPAGR